MKLLTTSFIFCLAICTVVGSDTVPVKTCPSFMKDDGKEKKCICYEPSRYVVCTGIDQTWINTFTLDNLYDLDTLVIKESPDLPLLSEHFHNTPVDKKKGFLFQSVIFSLTKLPVFSNDNLNYLVSLASKTIEIKLPKSTTDLKKINAKSLSQTLKSISFSNLHVTNLDRNVAHKLDKVKSLFLDTVSLDALTKVVIDQPTALTHIEIINSPSLNDSFQFIPSNCKADQQIVLNLQNNDKLIEFKMDKLFSDQKCKYHIDLSGSKLNPNFLTQNHASISSAQDGQLFMILRDVPNLECKECTWDWYKGHKAVLHSVECKGKAGSPQYLDKFTRKEDFKPC